MWNGNIQMILLQCQWMQSNKEIIIYDYWRGFALLLFSSFVRSGGFRFSCDVRWGACMRSILFSALLFGSVCCAQWFTMNERTVINHKKWVFLCTIDFLCQINYEAAFVCWLFQVNFDDLFFTSSSIVHKAFSWPTVMESFQRWWIILAFSIEFRLF